MRYTLLTSWVIGALILGFAPLTAAAQSGAASTAEGAAPESPAEEPGNLFCPVMPEEEIDLNFFSLYEGRKVYLCCRRCRTTFENDPEAYLANLPPLVDPVALTDEVRQGEPDAIDTEPAAEEHDDSADAETDAGGADIVSYVGRFHVVTIHFPIALLLFGAFIEAMSMVRRRESSIAIVRACMGFGALSAVVAAALGLMNAVGAEYAGVMADAFWWHRLLGLVTAAVAVVAWGAVELRARRPGLVAPSRFLIFGAAAIVGITGHLGGSLVFGWDYLIP